MVTTREHDVTGNGNGSPIEHILGLLSDVKPTANGWDARCPAHDDTKPSLGVKVGDDGRVLFNCRSQGCKAEAIAAGIGLKLSDLFARHGTQTGNGKPQSRIVATYPYRDEHGATIYEVVRFEPKDFRQRRPNGSGGYIWNLQGIRRVPYKLPEMLAADRETLICIVEGERDVHTLEDHGFVATTNAQGAEKWTTIDVATAKTALGDRDLVVFADNDRPGRNHATDVCRRVHPFARSIKRIDLPDLPDKGDVTDWFSAGGTAEELQVIIDTAPYWMPDVNTPGDECGGESPPPSQDDAHPSAEPLPIMTLGELTRRYPNLRKPLIHGFLREGETANIIAASKIGKSWLAYLLAICVAMGRKWLDFYETTAGDVLLIDNELHPETIANRIPRVCSILGIAMPDVENRICVLPLRGRLQALPQIGADLLQSERGRFKLIVVDAFYRAPPKGSNENDNASMAEFYNEVDRLADGMGAAVVLIHHASKGSQAEKSITDVGSGAGAQSRAADTHIILRPHENANTVVMEAVVRSWPPVSPICLKYIYPLWQPDTELDPTKLKTAKPRKVDDEAAKAAKKAEKQAAQDAVDEMKLFAAVDKAAKKKHPVSQSEIRAAAGFNPDKLIRVMDRLDKVLEYFDIKVEGGNGAKIPAKSIRRKLRSDEHSEHLEHSDETPDLPISPTVEQNTRTVPPPFRGRNVCPSVPTCEHSEDRENKNPDGADDVLAI